VVQVHRARSYCVTLIGAVVSLVSVNENAPPFTANGELVSEVACANARTCAVSSDMLVDVGGGVGGGVVDVVEAGDPLSWWHAAAAIAAALITPSKRILDFMAYSF